MQKQLFTAFELVMHTIRSTCPQIIEGKSFPVLEISLVSNLAKFPFRTMDYGHQEI